MPSTVCTIERFQRSLFSANHCEANSRNGGPVSRDVPGEGVSNWAARGLFEELIQLAKDMRAANNRGEDLKLSEDELAFYDTVEVNDSAVKVLGEPTLVTIARELVDAVKKNVTIDWTVRSNIQAQLRVILKRILRKYGYPPDKQERATHTALEQAALLSHEWLSA